MEGKDGKLEGEEGRERLSSRGVLAMGCVGLEGSR